MVLLQLFGFPTFSSLFAYSQVAAGLSSARRILELSTGKLYPLTIDFFNTNVLPFDYSPKAPAPVEWQKFLKQLWPNDSDAIACLQEWFGYLLTADTRLQKILLLIGPRRGGKGTIFRVLNSLVGSDNIAAPLPGRGKRRYCNGSGRGQCGQRSCSRFALRIARPRPPL